MTERIEKINMDWFLIEPALFKVLCSHQVVANTEMQCPVRSGKRRIEYNPTLCKEMTDLMFREHFKAECVRILLKHPYQRQPQNCSADAKTLGSDCVLADNYQFKEMEILPPVAFDLPENETFEYYANKIQEMMPKPPSGAGGSNEEKQDNGSDQQQDGGDSGPNQNNNKEDNSQEGNNQNGGDTSSLWQEDAMAEAEINEMIQVMEASNQWGSLAGSLASKIIASSKVKIDYRRVLQSFRADMLSSQRRLTRMRPNRRSGFENFGSVYRLTSRLLVAIDVSGSTTDEMVSQFFGIVNKFFKYGIEEIDIIQFDAQVKGDPVKLKKARTEVNIVGRGGTDFQPVIDFIADKKNYYHGAIIFTDGYASPPQLPDFFQTPLLWVTDSERNYKEHKSWMKKLGKACFIQDLG